MRVDINCDMGESFGVYSLGADEEMMKYITAANIACGWHAGDPLVMDKTVQLAVQHGGQIGSHPGFPDLLGFGRRTNRTPPHAREAQVLYPTGVLHA